MLKKLAGIFLDSNEKAVKKVQPIVKQIREFESEFKDIKLEDLRSKVDQKREAINKLVAKVPADERSSIKILDKKRGLNSLEKQIQNELLDFEPQFFAIINEVYKKKIGISYFDVQFIAGAILSQGQKLTELKTGEGKTMVFQLPAFLYALTGRGSHVITVNDYLARVGGEYAGHIASELGLTIGIITPQASYKFITDQEVKKLKGDDTYKEMKEFRKKNGGIKISNMRGDNIVECDKREAYTCNVVYGTNNEFGFDYLRDNMANTIEDIKQGELYFAIIDEADSILIDEARTPLIISAPADVSNDYYSKFARAVTRLNADTDYTIDEKAHSAVLTEEGTKKMEKIVGVTNIWEDFQMAHHLDNALKALTLYKNDTDYIVKDGEILIVDQFTGRILPGRRYSEGLHQAIEAKEGVEIKKESQTLATITFQNFFRLYKIIGGGSGTILTEAEEFYKIYNLDSVAVPTNKPVIRMDKTDRVYKNRKVKFKAVAEEIKERHKTGQPMLVGTTSIEDSEYLSDLVSKMGIEHEVLNAKHHEREAHIVMKAGQKGAVTIATNMAGRGTDIPLEKGVQELGGLYVIGTQRHEARRIDNQLRGRSGRQGDPGETRFYVSLDDDIMRIQGGEIVQRLMDMTKIPDDIPIEARLIGRSIENAQKRMENMHFDSRKHVVEYDDVINQQREIFYVRRRGILELAEKAQGKFLNYPQVITKPVTDPAVVNARAEIKDRVKDTLFDEVERTVQVHMAQGLDQKEENIANKEKLITDFLDLASDESINETFDSLKKQPKNNDATINEKLLKEIGRNDERKTVELFEEIIRDLISKHQQKFGEDYFENIKMLYLDTMDQNWTLHLEAIQDLREGIGLRGYAQRDPIVEYKNESYRIFEQLIDTMDSNFARRVLKISPRFLSNQSDSNLQIQTNTDQISDLLEGSREIITSINNIISTKGQTPSKKAKGQKSTVRPKIGRNDPCWCGSGKKYKKCHGA